MAAAISRYEALPEAEASPVTPEISEVKAQVDVAEEAQRQLEAAAAGKAVERWRHRIYECDTAIKSIPPTRSSRCVPTKSFFHCSSSSVDLSTDRSYAGGATNFDKSTSPPLS
jgi:hypothetical protein